MTTGIDRIAQKSARRARRDKPQDWQIEKMYGKLPVWKDPEHPEKDIKNTDPNFRNLVFTAWNWANALFDREQYKQEVIKFEIKRGKSVQHLETLPYWKFMDAGKIAWLANNGCPLTESLKFRLEEKLAELDESKREEFDDVEIVEDEDGDKAELIVQEEPSITRAELKLVRQKAKISDLLADVDNIIDESIIKNNPMNESAVYYKLQGEHVDEKIANELRDKIVDKKLILNDELESLRNLTKDEIISQFDDVVVYEKYVKDLENTVTGRVSAINQLASYLGNKKALKKSERKVGKHKAKKIETQISNMNFKVQDETYKVMSINPASIVGAQTLVAFNTHTRKIAIYVAKDDSGLGVKGTTIQNFDDVLSVQKIVKKPDMLVQFQQGNIKRLKVLFKDNIKAKESPVNGRMNEHTILLKVYTDKYSPKA